MGIVSQELQKNKQLNRARFGALDTDQQVLQPAPERRLLMAMMLLYGVIALGVLLILLIALPIATPFVILIIAIATAAWLLGVFTKTDKK